VALQVSRQQQGIPVNGGQMTGGPVFSSQDLLASWFLIMAGVANIFFPPNQMSILLPSVVANDFSSMRFAFYGTLSQPRLHRLTNRRFYYRKLDNKLTGKW
jgi:hypothetical protein